MMIIPSRSSNLLFCIILWSTEVSVVFSQNKTLKEEPSLIQKPDSQNKTLKEEPSLIQKPDGLVELDEDPLAVLGKEDLTTLKSSWGLTVNDQCLYEFVYQFEHADSLPIGDDVFKGTCEFGGLENEGEPQIAPDGIPYLEPRRFYERFPDYVWATMGFNHLSVDWLPCGRRPAGYKTAQYDFSFFRVTPEYRAQTMVCKLVNDTTVTIVPGEEFCDVKQEEPNGMDFFIVPGAMIDRDPVVNMPVEFTHRHQTYGPLPHYGLRSWDPEQVPEKPNEWNDIPSFMSSYAGNLVMWQAHVPYKMVSGEESQFHSGANRYFETTIQTLPDTWGVKYDESDGKIQFTIVGKAEICRGDYERAQKAAGGAPIYPNYDDLAAVANDKSNKADGNKTDPKSDENNEEEIPEPSGSSITSSTNAIIIQILILLFALPQ